MNLIIDVGNTKVKLAIFSADKRIKKMTTSYDDFLKTIYEIKEKYPDIKHTILSSVGSLRDTDLTELKDNFSVLVLSASTKVPFENCYETPSSLGVDRIALVCASVNSYSNTNVLIIDAGTCITYDFVTSKNQYLGGAISPGIRLRYNALHNLTANLPLLDTKSPKNLIGNSTSESIHSGIINGILKELDGIVEEYQKKYQDLTVILTGGDAKFLSKQLKSSIFANSNFLLEGLNFILEFNKI